MDGSMSYEQPKYLPLRFQYTLDHLCPLMILSSFLDGWIFALIDGWIHVIWRTCIILSGSSTHLTTCAGGTRLTRTTIDAVLLLPGDWGLQFSTGYVAHFFFPILISTLKCWQACPENGVDMVPGRHIPEDSFPDPNPSVFDWGPSELVNQKQVIRRGCDHLYLYLYLYFKVTKRGVTRGRDHHQMDYFSGSLASWGSHDHSGFTSTDIRMRPQLRHRYPPEQVAFCLIFQVGEKLTKKREKSWAWIGNYENKKKFRSTQAALLLAPYLPILVTRPTGWKLIFNLIRISHMMSNCLCLPKSSWPPGRLIWSTFQSPSLIARVCYSFLPPGRWLWTMTASRTSRATWAPSPSLATTSRMKRQQLAELDEMATIEWSESKMQLRKFCCYF